MRRYTRPEFSEPYAALLAADAQVIVASPRGGPASIDPRGCQVEHAGAKRAEHYDFLIAHQSDIVFGGPARSRPDGPPQTMIIVVEAPTAEAAHAFIAAEPYNRNGGFSMRGRRRGESQRVLPIRTDWPHN
ncbi:YciI family protein [Mycobacterium sp. ML4]